MLEGFKVFNINEGVPYVSITSNGVTFNKSVVLKLNKPEFVLFLIDEETGRIALQTCEANTPDAVSFYKQTRRGVLSIRWNGRDLLKTLSTLMKWDLTKESFRIEGDLIKEENAIIFDLNKAREMV